MPASPPRGITTGEYLFNKDNEMRLKTGTALGLTLLACAGHARDLQTISQSGELKVGVPGTTRRWRFTIRPGSCSATMSIWRKISAKLSG